MHYDNRKHWAQQLEQVIATVFTCRSLVKYHLSLDAKQQKNMLQDIDSSLEILQEFVHANRAVQPDLTDMLLSQTDSARIVRASEKKFGLGEDEPETLQAL